MMDLRDLRVTALDMALRHAFEQPAADVVARAEAFLAFLTGERRGGEAATEFPDKKPLRRRK